MAAPLLHLPGRVRLAEEARPSLPGERRSLPRGRLIELAGGPDTACTSVAVEVVRLAQEEGEPALWAQPEGGGLYPPDLARAGVDLGALVVVHLPPSAGPGALPRAAELGLRTGAFGAVILDLGAKRPPRGDTWLGRLAALAREHDCRVVLLGPEGRAGSFGPLVSLRLYPRRRRVRPGRFRVEVELLKDKSGLGAGLSASLFEGPEGLP